MADKTDLHGDLYKLLDSAGLNAANMLDSRRNMSKICVDVKSAAVTKLIEYINKREGVRKIEVKDDRSSGLE